MRKDYKVRPRARETIKGFAEDIRLRAKVATTATCFDVIDVLRQMQSGRVLRTGNLIIAPFTQGDGDPPAFVKYNPLRLFIDREIERDLELNEPMARFIASHEIGHIFMHDGEPQRYSGERQRWVDFEEES